MTIGIGLLYLWFMHLIMIKKGFSNNQNQRNRTRNKLENFESSNHDIITPLNWAQEVKAESILVVVSNAPSPSILHDEILSDRPSPILLDELSSNTPYSSILLDEMLSDAPSWNPSSVSALAYSDDTLEESVEQIFLDESDLTNHMKISNTPSSYPNLSSSSSPLISENNAASIGLESETDEDEKNSGAIIGGVAVAGAFAGAGVFLVKKFAQANAKKVAGKLLNKTENPADSNNEKQGIDQTNAMSEDEHWNDIAEAKEKIDEVREEGLEAKEKVEKFEKFMSNDSIEEGKSESDGEEKKRLPLIEQRSYRNLVHSSPLKKQRYCKDLTHNSSQEQVEFSCPESKEACGNTNEIYNELTEQVDKVKSVGSNNEMHAGRSSPCESIDGRLWGECKLKSKGKSSTMSCTERNSSTETAQEPQKNTVWEVQSNDIDEFGGIDVENASTASEENVPNLACFLDISWLNASLLDDTQGSKGADLV